MNKTIEKVVGYFFEGVGDIIAFLVLACIVVGLAQSCVSAIDIEQKNREDFRVRYTMEQLKGGE